jgi:hypothetical protein
MDELPNIIISKGRQAQRMHIHFHFYLQGSQCLIYTTPNAKVVNGRMLDDTFLVDDKEATKSNTLVTVTQTEPYQN